jgi:hypothetical protein
MTKIICALALVAKRKKPRLAQTLRLAAGASRQGVRRLRAEASRLELHASGYARCTMRLR